MATVGGGVGGAIMLRMGIGDAFAANTVQGLSWFPLQYPNIEDFIREFNMQHHKHLQRQQERRQQEEATPDVVMLPLPGDRE